jgi:pyruvate dehydrogenase E2 component (dihydrolipoamide acetyltransferase)
MAQIIDMPKLSDTMTVGTLVKWLKNEGAVVKSGDMLAEVETDKATMELESFFDGTLLRHFVAAGAQVPIGAPLCAIGEKGEKVEAPPAIPDTGKRKPDSGERKAETGKPAAAVATPDSGNRIPDSPVEKPEVGAKTSERKLHAAGAGAPASTVPSLPSVALAKEGPVSGIRSPVSEAPSGRIRISPLARKLAAEKGIDYSRLQGSGPGGRIVRADIVAAGQSGAATPSSRSPSALSTAPSLLAKGPIQADEVVPVSNMRATIARRLVESKTQIPHFYVEVEIDAEPLLALRAQLNSGLEKDGVKLTVSDFILKASAEALRAVPAVNCSWENDPTVGAGLGAIRHHSAAHVAFAVAIEDGLITPVIRDAHLKTIFQISTEARELAGLAKTKKLKPEQFTGGTFCISNLGMMGVDRFTAIINPPNAAILAIGTTVKKPVVRDDRIEIGQRMSLFLSCDHRAVDGATGARYLAALKELLEKPALLLV